MTNLELAKKLLDDLAEHGEREVRISLRSGTLDVAELSSEPGWLVFLRSEVSE